MQGGKAFCASLQKAGFPCLSEETKHFLDRSLLEAWDFFFSHDSVTEVTITDDATFCTDSTGLDVRFKKLRINGAKTCGRAAVTADFENLEHGDREPVTGMDTGPAGVEIFEVVPPAQPRKFLPGG